MTSKREERDKKATKYIEKKNTEKRAAQRKKDVKIAISVLVCAIAFLVIFAIAKCIL